MISKSHEDMKITEVMGYIHIFIDIELLRTSIDKLILPRQIYGTYGVLKINELNSG